MRKKKIVSIGLIIGLIMAAGSFIFMPHSVWSEDDPLWNYHGLWDYSYNDWVADYASRQSPSFNYSTSWDDNYLRSGQSYIAATEADFLGLLSQGTTVYVPPGAFAYANAYGTLGSPGGYIPSAQWPAYSYAMPLNTYGMYILETYPGQFISSLIPMTREEWWEREVEKHSLEYAKERAGEDGIVVWLPGFSEVPPWEEQPLGRLCIY